MSLRYVAFDGNALIWASATFGVFAFLFLLLSCICKKLRGGRSEISPLAASNPVPPSAGSNPPLNSIPPPVNPIPPASASADCPPQLSGNIGWNMSVLQSPQDTSEHPAARVAPSAPPVVKEDLPPSYNEVVSAQLEKND
jgi:hypothetical protein